MWTGESGGKHGIGFLQDSVHHWLWDEVAEKRDWLNSSDKSNTVLEIQIDVTGVPIVIVGAGQDNYSFRQLSLA